MVPKPEQAERVWRGAAALEPFLVPVDELEPFPGNARRGHLPSLRASLARFGQTRPILTDARDARRIVAGHHIVLAAREEGWTHVAAIPNEFADEEEARRYLLADNRLPDLGGYDDASLRDLLSSLEELEGTGYSADDLADLDRELAAAGLALDAAPPTEFPPIDPDTLVTEHECPSCGYQWSGNP